MPPESPVMDGKSGKPLTTIPRLVETSEHDLIATLVNKQIEVLAEGSELSRHRQKMGELKKARDGIIAEITRRQVKIKNLTLPLGLTTNDEGYVVAESDDEPEDEE